ncbi:hypothetical protein ACG0Z6_00375 [Roseateles sp. BYS180W]|uniref:Porin n=1 Tax=Roseateles rivi TaxID=3299028 RepID=A0ABW7FQX8_9BURK
MALLCTVVGAQTAAPASEPELDTASTGQGLRISGFGTLGATRVNTLALGGFRRDTEQAHRARTPVLGVDSRLGLQLNWQPTPQWQAVAQVLVADSVQNKLSNQSLSMAFAGWSPLPQWTLRLGRLGLDAYMLGDVRQVGVAYPWVRPSPEFYGWMPIYALDGADVEYNQQNWGWRWRLKVQGGQTGRTVSHAALGKYRLDIDRGLGVVLSAQRDGWTLRASQVRLRVGSELNVPQLNAALQQLESQLPPPLNTQAQALSQALHIRGTAPVYSAVGAAYELGAWSWMTEWSHVRSSAASLPNGKRWYVSAAYRWQDWQPYVMYAQARPDRPAMAAPQWQAALAPVLGAAAAAQLQMVGDQSSAAVNLLRNDQHSWSLGLRRDLAENIALKAQIERVTVRPVGGGLWGQPLSPQQRRATVSSVTVDFSF